jgi:hypothetical protein
VRLVLEMPYMLRKQCKEMVFTTESLVEKILQEKNK